MQQLTNTHHKEHVGTIMYNVRTHVHLVIYSFLKEKLAWQQHFNQSFALLLSLPLAAVKVK